MHKNIISSPKSWKSNQEPPNSPTNHLIDNYVRYSNPNVNHVMISSKNPRDLQYYKVTTIQRHYSEDDFKKYLNTQHGYYV